MTLDNERKYDIAIIGGGPAGYTAAIYASRAGRKTVLIEKGSPGGQMGITSVIENYPGFETVDGFELAMRMQEQAKKTGAELITAEVTEAFLGTTPKRLVTTAGTICADAVIIATGARPRLLGADGEREYTGRGVSYCATCDGMFFRRKTVIVNGGGNTALEDALYLSNICEKVIVVHRREGFRASRHEIEKARAKDNIEFRLNAVIEAIRGDGTRVTGAALRYTDGKSEEIGCAGVFIAIGRVPGTELYEGQLATDDGGYIAAGEDCRTSVDGVFAAGDVRTKKLRQIVTAASDGAAAAEEADSWLDEKR